MNATRFAEASLINGHDNADNRNDRFEWFTIVPWNKTYLCADQTNRMLRITLFENKKRIKRIDGRKFHRDSFKAEPELIRS